MIRQPMTQMAWLAKQRPGNRTPDMWGTLMSKIEQDAAADSVKEEKPVRPGSTTAVKVIPPVVSPDILL